MKKGVFCNIQIKILPINNELKEMDEDYRRRKSEIDEDYRKNKIYKCICSICLNPKSIEKSHSKKNINNCPICQNNCKFCVDKIKIEHVPLKKDLKDAEAKEAQKIKAGTDKGIKTKTKSIQTIESGSKKSLTLLNEVLTVFQSNKTERFITKDVKDACVSTEKQKATLSRCKTFQMSLDQNTKPENGKYLITSSKTDKSKIDLIKHKSSSIPQMKIEELKYSLKEKAKSRDVIEEVNRMYATFHAEHTADNSNRPSLRSGPRILPVVKNMTNQEQPLKTNTLYSCKCCHFNNCMSSGDSVKCNHREQEKIQCSRMNEVSKGCKCSYCTKRRTKQMGFDEWRALKEYEWDTSDRSFRVDSE